MRHTMRSHVRSPSSFLTLTPRLLLLLSPPSPPLLRLPGKPPPPFPPSSPKPSVPPHVVDLTISRAIGFPFLKTRALIGRDYLVNYSPIPINHTGATAPSPKSSMKKTTNNKPEAPKERVPLPLGAPNVPAQCHSYSDGDFPLSLSKPGGSSAPPPPSLRPSL